MRNWFAVFMLIVLGTASAVPAVAMHAVRPASGQAIVALQPATPGTSEIGDHGAKDCCHDPFAADQHDGASCDLHCAWAIVPGFDMAVQIAPASAASAMVPLVETSRRFLFRPPISA